MSNFDFLYEKKKLPVKELEPLYIELELPRYPPKKEKEDEDEDDEESSPVVIIQL